MWQAGYWQGFWQAGFWPKTGASATGVLCLENVLAFNRLGGSFTAFARLDAAITSFPRLDGEIANPC